LTKGKIIPIIGEIEKLKYHKQNKYTWTSGPESADHRLKVGTEADQDGMHLFADWLNEVGPSVYLRYRFE
jgi:hypothetical protein